MLLGEFREKTKGLDDMTAMVLLIEPQSDGENITRGEIDVSVNTIDLDQGVDGECILTLTNGKRGSYSL